MIDQETYNQYFNSLVSGNKRGCAAVLETLVKENTPVEMIYTQLFQRSLYQIGEYWEMNKISVATEHMATAITENLMISMQPQLFSTERTGKKAVIACVANEHHQVGAKMVADIFELNGWDGYFIGANTPVDELIRFVSEKKPDVLGLSLSIFYNLPTLKSNIALIRQRLPNLPIIVGGQAFRWGGLDIIEPNSNITYLSGIEILTKFINQ
jgi:MerR family transcriptional regulator, light-induced transcriptional regulator